MLAFGRRRGPFQTHGCALSSGPAGTCASSSGKRTHGLQNTTVFFPPDRKGLCCNPRLRCFCTTPPPSVPPEQLASRVSYQSCSPVDPAEYPARAARQWIPSSPAYPAEYPAEYPLPVYRAEYLASIEPEWLASICQWIPPVSRQSSSPVWFCLIPPVGAFVF